MKGTRLDQRLVTHDACILAIASVSGIVGTAVDSLALGMLVMGALIVLGDVVMRIPVLRWGINWLAYSLRGARR